MSTDDLEYIFRGEAFSIACMPGEAKPSLVLSAKAIADLIPVSSAAHARVSSLHPESVADAVLALCAQVEHFLKVYEKESVEWWARQPLPPSFAQASADLEAARRLFEESDFDPDDGPRRA